MKNTELVRELKKKITMAIWQENIALKHHDLHWASCARADREFAAIKLKELADNWSKK